MSEREEKSSQKAKEHGGARLRVLIVAPSLDIYGGQAIQAVRLMRGFSAEPTLEVGFLPHNPRLPGPLRLLQKIKYVRTIVTTFVYVLMLLWRVPRYDVIHVFSASYWSYLLSPAPALFIARLYGKPSILNYRSGEADDHLENWPRTAAPTMRWATVIVVPSGYLVDVFARHGLPARFIYNVVELDRFKFRERNPVRPVFVASRLHQPLYNVACALRAFRLIQDRCPQARLTVAGDGYLRPELERLAFEELRLRNTEFIGLVPLERMPELLDAADVYLNAPDVDNMPSSITECMASGLPVVTTDAGGIPYIVTNEETCLMIGRNDAKAMAEAAFRLLEEEGLALRLTRRAREESEKFQWPALRDQWVRLYRELASGKAADVLAADAQGARGRRSEA